MDPDELPEKEDLPEGEEEDLPGDDEPLPGGDASIEPPSFRTHSYLVPGGKSKERIDLFLTRHLPNATRTRVQKLIESGGVTVDDVPVLKPSFTVLPGQLILCTIPKPPAPDLLPEDIPLDIVYEDDAVLIVNKPPGMVVHPAHGNYTGTLVNALLHHASALSSVRRETYSPGILHRIDKGTSGLLAVAKTDEAHHYVASQFAAHTIEREYWAVVWGSFDASTGVIEMPVGRSPSDRKKMDVVPGGKYAYTTYAVLADYGFMSLVKLRLKTGRTHQIRVHMKHIRHPIFGDPTYGGRRIVYGNITPEYKSLIGILLSLCPRQALHAKTLGFRHPRSHDWVAFDSHLPRDMTLVLERLKEYVKRRGGRNDVLRMTNDE